METYDAPMFDTGDPDIAMYPGPSDMWLSVEAHMTDHPIDAHSHLHINQENHTSIEVDMQDHRDDGITEYEMADEVIGYEATGDDLLDVDVFDASRIHSPLVAPVTDASLFTPLEMPSVLSTPLLQPAPDVPLVTEPSADHSVTTIQVIDSSTNLDSLPQISISEDVTPSAEHVGIHEEASVSSVVQEQTVLGSSEPISEVPFEVTSGEVRAQEVTGHQEHMSHGDQVAHEEQINLEEQPPLEELHNVGVEDSTVTTHEAIRIKNENDLEHTAPSERKHLEAAQPLTGPSDEHHETQDGHSAVDDIPDVAHEIVGEHHDVLETTEVDAPKVNDPHEISDGIFIDPPPGVLLSLSSDEFPDYSLFNQPTPASGSQSPTGDAAGDGDVSLPLLLHSRPTLYYEPFSNVFQALRQEESLQNLPYFADGEIVLDAYDLQLAISEDNVHASEVTLHDLNVLHDGSDLSGPLRLQLRIDYPRFINRYHHLREQISRLTLAAEEAGGGELSIIEHYQEESFIDQEQQGHEHEYEDEQIGQEQEQRDSESAQQAVQEEQDLAQQHESTSVHEESSVQIREERENAGDVPQLNVGDEAEEGYENVDATEEPDGEVYEDGTAVPQEEAPEVSADANTDADADGEADADADGEVDEDEQTDDLHESEDIGEGGDYVEYAEYNDDDDERFGEDLPQDLGGSADTGNSAYDSHVTLDEVAEQDDTAVNQAEPAAENVEDIGGPKVPVGEQDTDAYPELDEVEDIDEHDAEAFTLPGGHVTIPGSPFIPPDLEDDTASSVTAASDVKDADASGSSDIRSAPDAQLRKSPSTSSKLSKRSRDDFDLDDEEESFQYEPLNSPELKRPRTQ